MILFGSQNVFFLAIAPNGHDLTVDFPKQLNWTGLISEMELVPCSHEGITCNGCNMNPIKGVRFKCKVCDNYDYCENCFYTKMNHRHYFNRIVETGWSFQIFVTRKQFVLYVTFVISGAPEVFAGKPGKYYRHDTMNTEGLITGEWSRCVRNVTLSSRDQSGKYDIPNGTWQSCGAQGKVCNIK